MKRLFAIAVLGILFHASPILAFDVEQLVAEERSHAEKLFGELKAAAGVTERIPLLFDEDMSYFQMKAFFEGGCYEILGVKGAFDRAEKEVRAYQDPHIFLTYGILWAGRKEKSALIAFTLAHELTHYLRSQAGDRSCENERRRIARERKEEEVAADLGAVALLTLIGLDGARIAEDGLRILCESNPMACAPEDPAHPCLEERVSAIRQAADPKILNTILENLLPQRFGASRLRRETAIAQHAQARGWYLS